MDILIKRLLIKMFFFILNVMSPFLGSLALQIGDDFQVCVCFQGGNLMLCQPDQRGNLMLPVSSDGLEELYDAFQVRLSSFIIGITPAQSIFDSDAFRPFP
jgi:hypothetical protein